LLSLTAVMLACPCVQRCDVSPLLEAGDEFITQRLDPNNPYETDEEIGLGTFFGYPLPAAWFRGS
jgi:hypothetical protein